MTKVHWCLLWVVCFTFPLSGQADVYRYNYSTNQSNLPPFTWYSARDEGLRGYTPMLVKAVAEAVNIKVTPVPIPGGNEPGLAAREALMRVITGESAFYFLPREYIPSDVQLTVFPIPIFQIETSIFVGSDSSMLFRQWTDLEGLRGGGIGKHWVSGSLKFDRFASDKLSIKRYPDTKTLVTALAAGEVDYIIGMKKPVLVELRLLNKVGQFVPVGGSIAIVPVHWFISQRSPLHARASEIEKTLAWFHSSGRMKSMMQKAMKDYIEYRHFSSGFTQ